MNAAGQHVVRELSERRHFDHDTAPDSSLLTTTTWSDWDEALTNNTFCLVPPNLLPILTAPKSRATSLSTEVRHQEKKYNSSPTNIPPKSRGLVYTHTHVSSLKQDVPFIPLNQSTKQIA